MLLYRTHNPPPALQTVIAATPTSFPAHDLGADTGPAHRVLPAEKSSWGGRGIRSFHLPEILSLQLPFATAPLFHSMLAAR